MKILIIQQKMIGDVLTSSILFEALKQKHPESDLHYLINSHTYPVVENNPYIDKFIFITPEIEKSKLKFFSFLKTIRKENYNILIDVYSKTSSHLISLFSGSKIKISKHKSYTSFIYTNTFKESKSLKTNAGLAIENRLQLLKPIIKSTVSPIRPKIYLKKHEIQTSRQFLKDYNIDLCKPLFMISVLGSDKNKTYPLPYMAQLIDVIVLENKAQILFNYLPEQLDDAKAVYSLCKKETQQYIYFEVFGKNLRDFLAITKNCDALIGNEGGAVNMAKALNIPTFTVFSPWIKKETWAMFENGTTNTSVHLKDFMPNLFEGKETKDLKSIYSALYLKFKPKLFSKALIQFIKQ